MGKFLDAVFGSAVMSPPNLPSVNLDRKPAQTFSVPAVGSDYETWQSLIGNELLAGKVTRREFMSIPAAKRSRDLLCSVAASLPLHCYRDGTKVDRKVLEQPERNHGRTRPV